MFQVELLTKWWDETLTYWVPTGLIFFYLNDRGHQFSFKACSLLSVNTYLFYAVSEVNHLLSQNMTLRSSSRARSISRARSMSRARSASRQRSLSRSASVARRAPSAGGIYVPPRGRSAAGRGRSISRGRQLAGRGRSRSKSGRTADICSVPRFGNGWLLKLTLIL